MNLYEEGGVGGQRGQVGLGRCVVQRVGLGLR